MSLYSIYADTDNFQYIQYDWKQISSELGDNYRFDMDRTVKPYAEVWTLPIRIDFGNEGLKGTGIPDISAEQGRLFLSAAAYEKLKFVLDEDGEFLPVIYKKSKGYIFNPLRLAEEVNGLDEKLSVKNEWGDVENIAFDESRVKPFNIFKTQYDNFYSVYCQQAVKDAVEQADLKGVIFTPDLGNYLGVADFMKN